MNREDAVKQLGEVFGCLLEDFEQAKNLAKNSSNNMFSKRTVYRTFFSYVEGTLFQFRNVLLCSAKGTDILSLEETLALREEKVVIDKKGCAKSVASFQNAIPSLLFTFKSYTKAHGTTFEPDRSEPGWSALKESFKKRNGLMHPKSLSDLDISEEDDKSFIAGANWFHDTVVDMLDKCKAADRAYSDS